MLALLVAQHAEQVQRIDMDRIDIERRAVVAFSFVEAAVTMRRESAVEYRMHDGGRGLGGQTRIFPTLGRRIRRLTWADALRNI